MSSDLVAVHVFPDTGRGLQAKKNIARNSVILSAPLAAVWTVDAAFNEEVLGDILRSNQANLSADDTLALYLLFVKKSPKCTSEAAAARKEHVRSGIPEEYTASVFFSDEALRICEGSSLHALTVQSMDQIEQDFRSLLQRIFLSHPQVFPINKITLDEYKWALFTVWSRAMDFQLSETKSLRGIVPFLDMANHSFSVPQCHAFDTSDNCIKIIAGRDYKAGDEVFINYGNVSNTKLARLYGFIIPDNPYNDYTLVLSTSPYAPFFSDKAQIYQAAGIALDSNFSLTRKEPLPVAVLQYLRIQRLEWSELNFATAARDKSKVGLNRITLRNEQEILSALVEAFEGILAGFAVKSDELKVQLELNAYKQYSDCWMAAHVSLGEQEILQAALSKAKFLLGLLACAECGKVEEDSKGCSRCNSVSYCNVACQKAHWPTHKLTCLKK
ncbi:hypothetical protein HDU81_007302 [Chytriomyces hyalinus]|nr:hypothetical protein HDU81_007302 [Chytriomyces hyalinus]